MTPKEFLAKHPKPWDWDSEIDGGNFITDSSHKYGKKFSPISCDDILAYIKRLEKIACDRFDDLENAFTIYEDEM